MNDKICETPENTRKIKVSHILETTPTYATKYYIKKGLHKNI